MTSPSLKRLNLQGLRAIAALGVLFHHIVDAIHNDIAPSLFKFDPGIGGTGVNLFFALSGYLMLRSTMGRSIRVGHFLLRRLLRVVPIYWLLTIVICISAIAPFGFDHKDLTVGGAIRSLLFVPDLKDGVIVKPVLFVGWSLNYEMFFYLIFGSLLLVKNVTYQILAVACSFIALCAVASLASNPYVRYYGDSIILAFVAGLLVGPLLDRRRRIPSSLLQPFALVVIGLLGLASVDAQLHLHPTVQNFILACSSALLIYAAESFEDRRFLLHRRLIAVGNSSYSLYLIHPFVILVGTKATLALDADASLVGLAVSALLMAAVSLIVAEALYRQVETRLIFVRIGRNRSERRQGGLQAVLQRFPPERTNPARDR